MAVDAQYYSENMGLAMCRLQDLWVNPVSSSGVMVDASNFNPQQQPPVYGVQDLCVEDNTSFNPFSMAFSQSLADQLETQRLEIDWLLHLQVRRQNQSSFLVCSLSVGFFEIGFCFEIEFCFDCLWKQIEKLKYALQEQRKQQLGLVLKRTVGAVEADCGSCVITVLETGKTRRRRNEFWC